MRSSFEHMKFADMGQLYLCRISLLLLLLRLCYACGSSPFIYHCRSRHTFERGAPIALCYSHQKPVPVRLLIYSRELLQKHPSMLTSLLLSIVENIVVISFVCSIVVSAFIISLITVVVIVIVIVFFFIILPEVSYPSQVQFSTFG